MKKKNFKKSPYWGGKVKKYRIWGNEKRKLKISIKREAASDQKLEMTAKILQNKRKF